MHNKTLTLLKSKVQTSPGQSKVRQGNCKVQTRARQLQGTNKCWSEQGNCNQGKATARYKQEQGNCKVQTSAGQSKATAIKARQLQGTNKSKATARYKQVLVRARQLQSRQGNYKVQTLSSAGQMARYKLDCKKLVS